MADSDPVNATAGAMRRIMAATRRVETGGYNERGRQPKGPIPEDSSGEYNGPVVFTIDSYDYEQGVALCTIEYRPYGMDSVTNEIAGYEQIEVQDPAGCYFNEAEADLIGRWGTAIYMTPSASADPYRLPIWVVVGLCCPAA